MKPYPLALRLLAALLIAVPLPANAGIGAVGNGFHGVPDDNVPIHPRSGILAPDPPAIMRTADKPFMAGANQISPLYAFSLRARVLSKEHYLIDRYAAIAPYDVVLGWQEMSDSDVISRLTITQGDRWWHYHYSGMLPISSEVISLEAGNMHLIAGDAKTRDAIAGLVRGNVVVIQGYLVRVHTPAGWDWISAVGPDSEGPHGCKVVWVSKITVER